MSDYSEYIGSPDKTIFMAYLDNQCAGQIRLRRNWNKYCHIEDVAVGREYRGMGLGRKLINAAIQWAKEGGMPGLILETLSHEVIEFDKINFLTGKNASGKSTGIDALQLLFLADTSGSYINKAANGKSNRTLSGYLRGELGDDGDVGVRCLWNGRFTSYITAEFYDDIKQSYFRRVVALTFTPMGIFPVCFSVLMVPYPRVNLW